MSRKKDELTLLMDEGREESERRSSSGVRGRLNKKKTRGRKGRRAAIFAVEFLALAVMAVCFFVVSKWNLIQHVDVTKKTDVYGSEIEIYNTQIDESHVEVMEKGYINFVVFGVDARNNQTLVSGVNSDVIMICSINKETGDLKLVSVYRDTVMYMPNDGTYNKINFVGANWDMDSAMIALNHNLDLTLTDYVVVNWASVITAINLMGGVEVDVSDEMLPYLNSYLTFTVEATGIGSTQLTHSGYQLLDGPQAVAYCRVRKTDNDYMRTERQREIVTKMVQKAKTLGPDMMVRIADAVFKQTATTFDLEDIFAMCQMVDRINISGNTGFPFYKISQEYNPGVPNLSWPCFGMDMSLNTSLLHEFLYGTEDYHISPRAYQISEDLMNLTGVYAPESTTPVFPIEPESVQNQESDLSTDGTEPMIE